MCRQPPLKGRCHPPSAEFFPPAPCFSSHSDTTPAATFPASTASCRTTSRTPPPRRSHPPTGTSPCWPLPAAPPSPDFLGEPRLRSSCPAPPRDPTGARRQHLAAGQPPPRRHRARYRAGARASCARGFLRGWTGPPGRGPAGHPVGRVWQATTPHTVAAGRIRARHCAAFFKLFFNCLNYRNCPNLPKFVETCRSVRKLQNKFCWTPLEPLFAVGLTKLTFM
jgi:hypothetical protein